jgi:hypothetical protein
LRCKINAAALFFWVCRQKTISALKKLADKIGKDRLRTRPAQELR